ncbi:helix-turn-helix domain-containing protein [Ditylenchus destructor]|uniref:Helix-turn-helix domain-containing protein n=1 Tax=Ditylenchus destructor TaxID=166010 RepID=A0AAD4QST5_9BILA|nr:helix-turn-helix domain-containing protein [Ditylenchus destructor]
MLYSYCLLNWQKFGYLGTTPGSSERQTQQSFSYKNLLIRFSDTDNAGKKRTDPQTSKDAPIVTEELTTPCSAPTNHNGSLIPSHRGQAPPTSEPKRLTQQNFSLTNDAEKNRTNPQTSSRATISLESAGAIRSLTDNSPVSGQKKQNTENSSEKPNEKDKMTNRENSYVVKVGPKLINVLAAAIPIISKTAKNNDMVQPDTTEPSSRQFIVKDEPIVTEELTIPFSASTNQNGSLKPSNKESAAASPKRSRKQNFPDLYAEDIKSTQPQTSSSLPVVKEEPSLIDELAADIPGPSNNRMSPSNNERTVHDNSVVKDEPSLIDELAESIPYEDDLTPSTSETPAMDSDDELRIIFPAKRRKGPGRGKKPNLTTSEKEAIVRAKNEGHNHKEIARMFACTTFTVRRVLRQWESEGSVGTKMHSGWSRKTTEAMDLVIAERAKKAVNYAGVDAVRDVRKIFGIEICLSTGIRILRKHNLLRHRSTRKAQLVEDPEYQLTEDPEMHLPNPKRSRKQNLYVVDGKDVRGLSQMEQDELKIIPPKVRKEWKPTTTTVRRAVVNASSEGLDYRKIARIFNIDRKTVASIMKKWKTEGTVERTYKAPRKVNEAVERFVVSVVKEDPFKNAEEIRSEVRKKFNRTIAHRTASTILKRYNSFKLLTPKNLSQTKPT